MDWPSGLAADRELATARDTAFALAVAAKFSPRRPRCLLRTIPGWHVAPDAPALQAAGVRAERVMANEHGGYQLRAPQPFRFECWRLEWEGPTGTSP